MTRSASHPSAPLERFLSTPPGTWLILNVACRLDPPLLRLSGGRLHTGHLIGAPVLLLTTTGARTGRPRTTPLAYFQDGEGLVVIASAGGRERHPGWYHNLQADPRCAVLWRGGAGRRLAREAAGEERERLWQRALEVYTGYDIYAQRAGGRQIPVLVLAPDGPG